MLLMIEKPRATAVERALATLARAARAVSTAVDTLLTGASRALDNRRLLAALATMSEHDLRDIGLLPGDVRDATAVPAARDASLFLAERRSGRRPRH